MTGLKISKTQTIPKFPAKGSLYPSKNSKLSSCSGFLKLIIHYFSSLLASDQALGLFLTSVIASQEDS